MKILTILALLAFTIPAAAAEGIPPVDTLRLNADTLRFIRKSLETIRRETLDPSDNTRRVGSYLTGSQAVVSKLIFELAALGAQYADYLYALGDGDTSKAGTATAISLGLLKDARVKNDVREIVRNETDPSIRAVAVRALSMYGDTLDIPLFLEAMADTNVVVVELDVPTHDGQFHRKIDIVAYEAVPALYKLGYKWELDSINGGYKAVKIEK